MNETRIYKRGVKNKYESFFFILPEGSKNKGKKSLLNEIELKKLIFLLGKERLLTIDSESHTEKLLKEQGEEEKKIEKNSILSIKNLENNSFSLF